MSEQPPSEHKNSYESDPAAQPDPNTQSFPTTCKRQPRADSNSHHGITSYGKKHWPSCIVQAAEHACTDDLNAINYLDQRSNAKKGYGELLNT